MGDCWRNGLHYSNQGRDGYTIDGCTDHAEATRDNINQNAQYIGGKLREPPIKCYEGALCYDSKNACEAGVAKLREIIEDCIDDCAGVTCSDHGTCACTDGVDAYTCKCDAGYSGSTCSTNIDECANADCGNGVCTDGVDTHTCECPAGWDSRYGRDCRNNIDDCFNVFCSDHGTCVDGVDAYMCKCDAGYVGKDCATPPTTTTWPRVPLFNALPTATTVAYGIPHAAAATAFANGAAFIAAVAAMLF